MGARNRAWGDGESRACASQPARSDVGDRCTEGGLGGFEGAGRGGGRWWERGDGDGGGGDGDGGPRCGVSLETWETWETW